MVKIAVIGFGNIGSGLVELVERNKDIISRDCGTEIEIKYIVDIRDFTGHPLESKIVSDFNIVVNDPEISVVAEMIGGSHPAFEFSQAALKAGKSVVTSNKEVVANFGDVLMKTAEENGAAYLFEAAVGGAIPIIRPMRTSLSADNILGINGILNGTTNFILTSMFTAGASFDDALAEARRLGYAEANPAADVDGIDACRKICILSALAYGKAFKCDDIHTEGIRNISKRDISDAEKLGASVKLIAHTSMKEDGRIAVMVSPRVVTAKSPLKLVNDVFNGIYVSAESNGDLMFYGRGAGQIPTAGAVLADVVEVVKHLDGKQLPAKNWTVVDSAEMIPVSENAFAYYCRVKGEKIPDGATLVSYIEGESAFTLPVMKEADCDNLLSAYEVTSRLRFID